MPFLPVHPCLSHCNLLGRCHTSWSSTINVVTSLRMHSRRKDSFRMMLNESEWQRRAQASS